MSKEKWMNSGFSFDEYDRMTPEEKAAFEQENPFPYLTFEEYAEDVVEWLCLSDWHYSEERARKIVRTQKNWIRESFEAHTPIDLVGSDAGYGCG